MVTSRNDPEGSQLREMDIRKKRSSRNNVRLEAPLLVRIL